MNADVAEAALRLHEIIKGKLEIKSRIPIRTKQDLGLLYTPGAAVPCGEISRDPKKAYNYTWKGNAIAVVSDGSSVYDLGNVGPQAVLPLLEGKAAMYKEFAGINTVPLCVDARDTREFIDTIVRIAPTFGGIHLEGIASPRCFELEAELKERLRIPVFHEDLHGTAVVVLAAVINALKLVNRKKEDCRVVISGAGSAGISIAKLLLSYGFSHILLCDRKGILAEGREDMNPCKEEAARLTNPDRVTGILADAIVAADIFIGASAPGLVTQKMAASMNPGAILFALSSPDPEIMPEEAKNAGAAVIGTGRPELPNEISNALAFPGIFKGLLEAGAEQLTEEMALAAALALADLVADDKLNPDFILPFPFDPAVTAAVAEAVKGTTEKKNA